MKVRLLLIVFLLISLAICQADILVLTDGTTYEGKVFKDGGQTTIITTKGEMKSFPNSKVRSIKKEFAPPKATPKSTPKSGSSSSTSRKPKYGSSKSDAKLSKFEKARKIFLRGDFKKAIDAYKVLKPKVKTNPIDVKFYSSSCARMAFLENDAGNSKKAFKYALQGLKADENVTEECRKIAIAKGSQISRDYAEKKSFK